MNDEMWVLGDNKRSVFTENGRLVAAFTYTKEAEHAIDNHNLDVELNRPESPEVVKSREEQRTERLKQWKEIDPTGYRLFELVISAAQRGMNFLSLKAPEFLIAQQLQQMQERILTLQQLHPMPEGFEDGE